MAHAGAGEDGNSMLSGNVREYSVFLLSYPSARQLYAQQKGLHPPRYPVTNAVLLGKKTKKKKGTSCI